MEIGSTISSGWTRCWGIAQTWYGWRVVTGPGTRLSGQVVLRADIRTELSRDAYKCTRYPYAPHYVRAFLNTDARLE